LEKISREIQADFKPVIRPLLKIRPCTGTDTAVGHAPVANKAANQRRTTMRFVLFLTLAIVAVTTIAAFATGGGNGTDGRKYDYWTSSDASLPFARRPQSIR
jgi:hypothetical protein